MQQSNITSSSQTLTPFKENELNLMHQILNQRKASAIKIQQHWQKKRSLANKHFALLSQVLNQRIQSASLLASAYRNCLYRRKVKDVIKKSKDYYSIIPIVQSDANNSFEIRIYFKKGKVNTFKLSYCPVRKIYLFDVPRRMVSQLKYKFCFVINGSPVIDPQYPHIFSHGEYLNVISIKDIQDKELLRELEFSNEKEKYYSMSSPKSSSTSTSTTSTGNNTSSSSCSNESVEEYRALFASSPIMPIKIGHHKSLTPKAKKLQMSPPSFIHETKDDSLIQSPSVKSILKELKSFKTKRASNSSKHVSFGKVETCCRSLLFI